MRLNLRPSYHTTLLLLLPALLRHTLAYTPLSNNSLALLPPASDTDFDIHNGRLLAPILQPRVPGTPGSDAVLSHLVHFFATNLPDWHLSFQNSTSTTPTSGGVQLPFRNLIATRDPPWVEKEGDVGRLALVAHYDSKLTPTGFIGATDSAAPCAMLLHTAQALDAALTRKWTAPTSSPGDLDGLDEQKGLQILLLDGEEAFHSWTATDSLYGARALAAEWDATLHPAMSTYRTPLASLDLFLLLDLLGAPRPTVPSYFKTTHWAYQHLASVEARMRSLNLLRTGAQHAPFLSEARKGESDRWIGGYVEDDHVPFMARGVEVLHLIPSPFPHVWHTSEDDGEHLDADTVADWAVVTTAFAAEWMELEGFLGVEAPRGKEKREWEGKSELESE